MAECGETVPYFRKDAALHAYHCGFVRMGMKG
jgi:hypothetical protein